jgi:prepilin-type N-terminal cleavage/methylation domain-containing protein
MRRRAQGFTLIEIMVVIAIIAGLIGTVVIVVPQMQERQRKLSCAQNLKQLGDMFVTMRSEKPGAPAYNGQALFLSWRTKRNPIREGEEGVLICPGDQGVVVPNTEDLKKAYDDIDLANPPTDKCSYAVRNFKTHQLSMSSGRKEIVACDRQGADGRTDHHQDGINVVYDNAQCVFMSKEELGFTTDSALVVGPESPNEDLKKVVFNVSADK